MRRRRKKRKISYIVLTIVGILAISFTVICLWLFYLYQSIPDTLVTAFYGTVVGELLITGLIRITKTKYGEENNNDNN